MIIKTKSKTFLVGEYCVMYKGSAIILCTNPNFYLRVKRNNYSILRGIPKESPAFYFYQENRKIFDGLFIKFIDFHKKAGGFGASSAQFVLLYKLRDLLINKGYNNNNNSNDYINDYCNNSSIDISEFLKEYKRISGKGYEIPPSGADCVSQILNISIDCNSNHNSNIIYFDSLTNKYEKLNWNFDNIDFLIFRTGNKIPTYSHLKTLSFDLLLKNCDSLNKIVKHTKQFLQQKEEKAFIQSVIDFSNTLDSIGLIADETKDIIKNLLKINGVLAAKGCGALGADTISVFFRKEAKFLISNIIKNNFKKISF